VAAQAYATEPWPDLVNLWLLLNRHLVAHHRGDAGSQLLARVVIGANAPVTLSFLIHRLPETLEQHLEQMLG